MIVGFSPSGMHIFARCSRGGLFNGRSASKEEPAVTKPVTVATRFERAVQLLDASGYLQPKRRAVTLVKLRRLLLDLNLARNDARIMGGVFTSVAWKLGQKLSTTCQM